MISPVVDVAWVEAHPNVVIADVRYYLDGRSAADAYADRHIPGAVRVDMDAVLAEHAAPEAGRHPLPSPEKFAAGLSEVGIGDESVVVAYDDAGGAMAGRLVWLLRMLGHDAALLDGGLAAWPGELTMEVPVVEPRVFTPKPWPADALATIDEAASGSFVIDARAPERYRGETEPIDPRAGHIPGARNYPLTGNLAADGRFLAPAALQDRFADVTDASEVISYCGSGITACHNLIALEYAGLGTGRLYPGSWSQYSNTDRPAATAP
ncbi:sulfurtransferase [Tessaracoccus caeni]|uniref:sulfurtransferase n=1 Tax=Tessaracoccus caeni TaxID=3031239 RepID=UPI0023DC93DC|nr:sulfurtransferase [Tessaracoccus caeni]MDF1487920.1 sulfurtransferase [Tessaracoccus caeni]